MEAAMAAADVRLSAVDLNLLVVFDALMQERNVTRAARRVALSQPALSHALGRLRHMLKDELFIRSPRGMMPTPRADQLALPVRHALDELQRSLEPPQFEPAKAARSFRIAVDNYAAIVVVAPFTLRIAKAAPSVILEFRPSGTLNVFDLLDRGQLDLAIGPSGREGERFSQSPLLEDGFVAILRRSHPAAESRKLTKESFAALPHLEISSSRQETDFIDSALARAKLSRHITMRAPFLSAVRILAGSDAVAVLPRRIARELTGYRPLVVRDLPFASPPVLTAMTWPRWLDNDPAHRWLRENVERTAQGLPAD
jgi:DNA-binding transcriptional LysR family regulator